MPDLSVVDNPDRGRFEAEVNGGTAVLEYLLDGDVIAFTHTEVPAAARGRGVADALATTALDYAEARGLRVRPLCPFVGAFIRRHPEYQHLVR